MKKLLLVMFPGLFSFDEGSAQGFLCYSQPGEEWVR